jgi:uncharacterized membrane protein YwaF
MLITLTLFMRQGLFRKTERFRFYMIHEGSLLCLLDPILGHINSPHILLSHFFQFHFNVFPSTPIIFPMVSFLRFSLQGFCASHLCRA